MRKQGLNMKREKNEYFGGKGTLAQTNCKISSLAQNVENPQK